LIQKGSANEMWIILTDFFFEKTYILLSDSLNKGLISTIDYLGRDLVGHVIDWPDSFEDFHLIFSLPKSMKMIEDEEPSFLI
jgi:hypothetical protein